MNKLTSIIAVNGKALTKPQLNLLAKLETFGVALGDNNQFVTNTMSGVQRELVPLAVALYAFILRGHMNYLLNGQLSYNGHTFPASFWVSTRYFFLTFWPSEYFDLID